MIFYTSVSALLFLIPFFYPEVCFLHFVAFIPIMYASYAYPMRFMNGFLWGTVVFGAHSFWCLQMLINYNITIVTCLLWIGIVLFLSIFSGLWFYAQQGIVHANMLKSLPRDTRLCLSWLVSTVSFIYFIPYGVLSFFGVIEGYPFFNPFFIWAQYPSLLWATPYIGVLGYSAILIAAQFFCVQGYRRRRAKDFILSASFLSVFLIGFFFSPNSSRSIPCSYFITPWWFSSKEPMFSGYRMISEVAKIKREQAGVRFICMPESAFNWNIYEYYQFVEMMGQDAPDVAIAFGGHHREGEGKPLKSSFFVFLNGNNVFLYNKMHLIPFMERPCPLFTALGISLHNDEFFAYGAKDQNDIVTINGVSLQVFICSEFLTEAKRPKGVPVLFLCNDAWLTCDYAKKWVLLFIRFFEIRYGVSVFFGTVCGQTNITTSKVVTRVYNNLT